MITSIWVQKVKDAEFVEAVKARVQNLSIEEESWELISGSFAKETLELDVQKVDEGYLVYPCFMGNTLTQVDPIKLPNLVDGNWA